MATDSNISNYKYNKSRQLNVAESALTLSTTSLLKQGSLFIRLTAKAQIII
jgi:hypothetical protein